MPEQTVLAFDFGTKRVGVAVGDSVMRHAEPLDVIDMSDAQRAWQQISQLLTQWQPMHLVVGLPLYQDGKKHRMAKQVRRFAHQLKGLSKATVWFVDEQYTSTTAQTRLHEAGVYGKAQEPLLDKIAAQVILEAWLADGGVLMA